MGRELVLSQQEPTLELLASSAYDEHDAVTEVIRPSAVLPANAALRVASELSIRDALCTMSPSWECGTGNWPVARRRARSGRVRILRVR